MNGPFCIRELWLAFAFTVVVFAAGRESLATEQIREILIYNGQTNSMCTEVLEYYFRAGHPRPEELGGGKFGVSSACWRGYVGTWMVERKQLYLLSLARYRYEFDENSRTTKQLKEEIPCAVVFGDQKPPIKASWFSGVIRIPSGRTLQYVHMPYASLKEKDLYVALRNGEVTAEQLVDNTGFGATRSRDDFEWVLMGREPVKDDGKWVDARVIRALVSKGEMTTGTNIVTRGLFLPVETKKPARLWVPSTPTTGSSKLPLVLKPLIAAPAEDTHIEIQAQISGTKTNLSLEVISIRALKQGETIHHPSFKVTAATEACQPGDPCQ
jgi:hypothetical protein